MADELHDLKIRQNRQIYIGPDNDLALTSGLGTVEQSLGITAGDVLRPLIGEPITGTTYADIEARLEDALSRDPQISNVQRVDVAEVNRSINTVTINVFTAYNNSFELDITV